MTYLVIPCSSRIRDAQVSNLRAGSPSRKDSFALAATYK